MKHCQKVDVEADEADVEVEGVDEVDAEVGVVVVEGNKL